MNIKKYCMKNVKYFVLYFFIITVFLPLSSCITEPDVPDVNIVDLNLVQNGTYTGFCDYSATAKVKLEMKDQRIKAIEIVKHICTPIGIKAEMVVEDVINKQTNIVDAISGATISSMVILKAIEDALNKGIP